MKLKHTLSALLASVMLAGSALVSAPAFAAEPLPFEDVKADAWYYDAISDVYETGLMKGKTDTKFDPTAPMSRAEFVTVLSRLAAINAANYGYSDSLDFTDTDKNVWYADAAGWAVETGLTKGTSDTTFAPTREITRQEMAVLIVRFVAYLGETVPDNSKVEKFADAHKIASWATADIETMRKYGFVQGDQNGNFNPEGKADRASVATIAMRLLPFVTTGSIANDGKSDYVIVADESLIEASERMQYQVEYSTGAHLDVVKSSSAKKAIVLGTVSDEKLGADGYVIETDGDTVKITGNTPDGVYKGVSRFMLRATFDREMKYTSAADERYEHKAPIGKLTINGNDISKYTVYYPANASKNTLTAVDDLVKYIEMATDVKLPTSTDKPGSFGIILDETTVVVDGSVNKNEDNFTVKSEGNSIRLKGSANRGAAYAAYDFLEQCVGVLFLSKNQDYVKPAKAIDVKDVNYTESPLLAIRDNYNSAAVPSLKFRDYSWKMANGIHSFASLAPDFCKQYESQPCLLNEAVYEQVMENVIKKIEAKPNAEMVSVSANDVASWCDCEKCAPVIAEVGPSEYLIRFVNRVADDLKSRGYNDVLVHTFAYDETLGAPQTSPRDNVIVQFAPIEACVGHPMNNKCNYVQLTNYTGKYLEDWGKLDCNMYLWTYHSNYGAPIPMTDISYNTMGNNGKMYVECGVLGWQAFPSDDKEDIIGDLGVLRNYLIAKFMWNPLITEDEYNVIVSEFMEGYFGKGWEMIYEAFNTVNECDTGCHSIFETVNSRRVYFQNKMDTPYLVSLFDEAELHAESYTVWANIDRNQISMNIMEALIKFDKLYRSDNEDEYMQSQFIAKFIQDKLLAYRVEYGSGMFPNMEIGEFDFNPGLWRQYLDPPYFQNKIEDLTVEYPEKPIYIMPMAKGIAR